MKTRYKARVWTADRAIGMSGSAFSQEAAVARVDGWVKRMTGHLGESVHVSTQIVPA